MHGKGVLTNIIMMYGILIFNINYQRYILISVYNSAFVQAYENYAYYYSQIWNTKLNDIQFNFEPTYNIIK